MAYFKHCYGVEVWRRVLLTLWQEGFWSGHKPGWSATLRPDSRVGPLQQRDGTPTLYLIFFRNAISSASLSCAIARIESLYRQKKMWAWMFWPFLHLGKTLKTRLSPPKPSTLVLLWFLNCSQDRTLRDNTSMFLLELTIESLKKFETVRSWGATRLRGCWSLVVSNSSCPYVWTYTYTHISTHSSGSRYHPASKRQNRKTLPQICIMQHLAAAAFRRRELGGHGPPTNKRPG